MEPKKILNVASGNMLTVNGQQYNKLLKMGYTRQGNKLFPPVVESSSEEEVEQVRNVLARPTFQKIDVDYPTYELPFVRCVGCNKPLGHLYKSYKKLEADGVTPFDIFTQLNVKRPCCRLRLAKQQQIPEIEYNPYLVEGERPPLPRPTLLTRNPFLQPQQEEIISYVESTKPPTLRKKITRGDQVFYEDVGFTGFRQKPVAGGKYYVSYK